MSIQEIREALSGFVEKFGLSTFAELNIADLADLLVRLNDMERVIIHRIEVFLDERGEHTTEVFVEPGVTVKGVGLGASIRPEGEAAPAHVKVEGSLVFEPLASAVPGIVGTASQGPVGESVRVESWEECVRIFGEPTEDPASASAVVRNFFRNGGRACLATRMVEADDVFICPECKAEHSRGPYDPLSQVYLCLKCGYTGPKEKVEDVRVPCPKCDTSGVETKGDVNSEPCSVCKGEGFVKKGDIEFVGIATSTAGSVGKAEKGPVDTVVTVENEDEFKGEFGDGKTFSSDDGKQELKRRILDRMTAVDMVDAISNGCDLPNLADIIIDLFPPEEILAMTPKEGLCPECGATGKVYPNPDSVAFENCSRCSRTGKVIVEDEKEKALLCPKCNGSGFGETYAGVPSYCKGCDGAGFVPAATHRHLSGVPLAMPKHLDTPVVEPCPRCEGKGYDPERPAMSTPDPCSLCNGLGIATGAKREPFAPEPNRCQTCWGSGTDAAAKDRPCPDCDGTGKVPKNEAE